MNVTQELVVAARLSKPEMSQNELAEYLGVSKQTLSNWVNGLREVKDANIVVQIALKIGDPPGMWLEKLGREQKAPKEVVQWWHKVATAAAVLWLCVVPLQAKAATFSHLASFSGWELAPMYIMLYD